MEKFMFDTNAFSSLLTSKTSWKQFFILHKNDFEFLITSIQVEELASIKDENKENRIQHLLCLCEMNAKLVPVIASLGHWRLGSAVLGGTDNVYTALLNKNRSNVSDALIGDAAYREKCILVTDDKRFIRKLDEVHVPTVTFGQFCDLIGMKGE